MRNDSTSAPSARSPIVWPTEAWPWPITVVAAFGAAVFFLLPPVVYIVAGVVFGLLDRQTVLHQPLQLLIAQSAAYVVTTPYVLVVVPSLSHVGLRDLGLRAPTGREAGIAILGIVAMVAGTSLASVAMAAITHRHDTEAAVALLHDLHTVPERLLFAAVAIVMAPFVEELLFRLFLFNALSRYVTVPTAALLSSAIFGVAHSQGAGELLTVGVPLAIGGLVLVAVYVTSRNFWCNVITHGGFNAISVIAVLVFHAK